MKLVCTATVSVLCILSGIVSHSYGATSAYWRFEDNLNDSSGNGHTLSATGSPAYSFRRFATNGFTSGFCICPRYPASHREPVRYEDI